MATGGPTEEDIPVTMEEEWSDSECADIRVGWIYRLKKDQLRLELRKLRLPTEGHVQELRQRLTRHLRRESPSPTTVLVPTVTSAPSPIYTVSTALTSGPDVTAGYKSPIASTTISVTSPQLTETVLRTISPPPISVSYQQLTGVSVPVVRILSPSPVATEQLNEPHLRTENPLLHPPGRNPQLYETHRLPVASPPWYQPLSKPTYKFGTPTTPPVTRQSWIGPLPRVSHLPPAHKPQTNEPINMNTEGRPLRGMTPHSPLETDRPGTPKYNLEDAEINTSAVHRTRIRADLKPHRWGIHFNGSADGVAFMEQLQDVMDRYDVTHDEVMPILPELLAGTALAWYRNNRTDWRCWEDFVADFELNFYPTDYKINLEREINQRTQKPHETALKYSTALRTLIRRHGNMTPTQELYWLHRNMLPEYRMFVRRQDCSSVASLLAAAKEFETLRQDQPEERLRQSARNPRTMCENEVPPRIQHLEQRQTRHEPSSRNNVINTNRPRQIDRAPISSPMHSQPPKNRPSSHHQVQTPDRIDTSRPVCWRCGQNGHSRNRCPNAFVKFCSRCGTRGTFSRDCNCRTPEN